MQDYSTSLSNQVVRILLDDSTQSEFFKGIKIEDLLKKKDIQEKVWRTLVNLQKFNVWIEGLLSFNKNG